MGNLSRTTQAYIIGIIILAGIAAIWQVNQTLLTVSWLLLAACVAASFLQSIAVFGATVRSTYSLSWIIFAFILILQGPASALIVILVSHLVEWMLDRNRLAWYIQAFNVGNFFLVVTLSGQIVQWGQTAFDPGSLISFTSIVTGLVVFTLFNHLLVAVVIKLARGQSFAQSGVFGGFTLFLDFTLLCLGYAAAIIWQANPVALGLVLFITFMLYEALKVPALERKTEIDPKTQLYNARYFTEAVEEELVRSNRFKRPLSLLMADLDLLRNINNTYGHLAGDVVLQGIANILLEMTREYDIVSRFGGEEFAILLPETGLEDAYIVAERIRKCVEETLFEITTSIQPIRATMSIGIAGREDDTQDTNSLIHNADVALYRAKGTGRNRTCIYDEQLGLSENHQLQDWAKLDMIAKVNPTVDSAEAANGRFANNSPETIHAKDALDGQFEPDSEEDSGSQSAPQHIYPKWATTVFIAALSIFTAVLAYILIQNEGADINLPRILFIACIVLVMEAASIEIYVKDTTVSTSAALLIAGVILFNAPAAIILGLVIAFVSFAKRRIKLSRFLFNSSNHVLGGLIVAALIGTGGFSLENWSLLKLFLVGCGAAGLLFFSTTIFLTIAIGLDGGLSFKSLWSQRFLWLAPYYLALGLVAATLVFSYLAIDITGILVIVLPLLLLRYSQKQYIDHTETLVSSLKSTNVKLTQQASEITRLNEEMLMTLARSLDLRDPHVMEHSKHVSRYAVRIAKEMGLPLIQVENIRKAGLLHDIGKLGVPEDILFKPGKLTSVEYEMVKEHVTIGADLIKGCHSLEPLVPFILYHHEWFNGQGYPFGLKGDDIPLEARILSLADAIEAMASDRPYKAASSPELILQEIKRCSGSQFDPVIVQAISNIIIREGNTYIVNSARNIKDRNIKEPTLYSPHY